ncbi:MAG: hypothetical protein KKH98_16210 [Spirochaetes bacterium]|nr:hypothetical protein [Spirochaetota bacterium]
MKKRFIIFLLFLFMSGTRLIAYTYIGGLFLGDVDYALDSRSLGMGGTGIAFSSSPLAVKNNPANISMADRITLQVNGILQVVSEDILVTQKVTSDGPSSSDNNINDQVYFNFQSAGVIIPLMDMIGINISYYDFLDFNYRNDTIKYKSAQEKIGFYDLEAAGALNSLSIAASINIKKILYVGAGFDILQGSKSLKSIVYNYPVGNSKTEDISESIDMAGSRINLGVNVAVSRSLHAGLFYQTQPTVSFKGDQKNELTGSSVKIDHEITYPQRYGIGLAYELLAGFNTVFAADFIFTPWKYNTVFKDNTVSPSSETNLRDLAPYQYLSNSYELHLGAEHMIILKAKVLKMPIRYGLLYVPHYINDRIELAMITFGLGFEGPYLLDFYTKIDISLGIGKRNFIGTYGKEPYDPAVEDELKPRVDESIRSILVSLSLGF